MEKVCSLERFIHRRCGSICDRPQFEMPIVNAKYVALTEALRVYMVTSYLVMTTLIELGVLLE